MTRTRPLSQKLLASRTTSKPSRLNQRLLSRDLLLIIGGILIIFISALYVTGAYMLVGILYEIQQKDYTLSETRIDRYRQFFRSVKELGLSVEESPAYVKLGANYYLWTVRVPSEEQPLIYRWKHDLATNKVEALTLPAIYLDLELGYLQPSEVQLPPADAIDELARALARGTYQPPALPSAPSQETTEPLVEEPSPEEEATTPSIATPEDEASPSPSEEAPPEDEAEAEADSEPPAENEEEPPEEEPEENDSAPIIVR